MATPYPHQPEDPSFIDALRASVAKVLGSWSPDKITGTRPGEAVGEGHHRDLADQIVKDFFSKVNVRDNPPEETRQEDPKQRAGESWAVARLESTVNDRMAILRVEEVFEDKADAQIRSNRSSLVLIPEPITNPREDQPYLLTRRESTKLDYLMKKREWIEQSDTKHFGVAKWFDRGEAPKIGDKIKTETFDTYQNPNVVEKPAPERRASPYHGPSSPGEREQPLYVVYEKPEFANQKDTVAYLTTDRAEATRRMRELNDHKEAITLATTPAFANAELGPGLRAHRPGRPTFETTVGENRGELFERVDHRGKRQESIIVSRTTDDGPRPIERSIEFDKKTFHALCKEVYLTPKGDDGVRRTATIGNHAVEVNGDRVILTNVERVKDGTPHHVSLEFSKQEFAVMARDLFKASRTMRNNQQYQTTSQLEEAKRQRHAQRQGEQPKPEAPKPEAPKPEQQRQTRDEERVVLVKWGASGEPRNSAVTFTKNARDVEDRLAYPATHNDWTPRGGDEPPIYMVVERFGNTDKGVAKGWHTDIKVAETQRARHQLAVEQKQEDLTARLDRFKPRQNPGLPKFSP